MTLERPAVDGVRINVDDFGTELFDLERPQDATGRWIEDRPFVCEWLPDNPTDTVLVSGIIGLARAHELSIVAEEWNHTPRRTASQDLGCDLAQGYLFCPPVPAWQLPARAARPLCPEPASSRPAR
ncbi:MAG: EAL domain-containing protein [Thermomicrobiales bacterium]